MSNKLTAYTERCQANSVLIPLPRLVHFVLTCRKGRDRRYDQESGNTTKPIGRCHLSPDISPVFKYQKTKQYFAQISAGLEGLAGDELRRLGAKEIEPGLERFYATLPERVSDFRPGSGAEQIAFKHFQFSRSARA